MGPLKGAYYFFQKKPYLEMRDLFVEIKAQEALLGEEAEFHYVSAAFDFTFKAQDWLKQHNFPGGGVAMRTTKEMSMTIYDFKYSRIKTILAQALKDDPNLKVYFFGDNADQDAIVYKNLTEELKLNSEIIIRDVRAEATLLDKDLPVHRIDGVQYFFSERELVDLPSLSFMSEKLKSTIQESYKSKVLIPEYTLETLKVRLNTLCLKEYSDPSRSEKKQCKQESEVFAGKYWGTYYDRFLK